MTDLYIRHIDDVLPHIGGRNDFIHGERDGYQFIDYNYTEPDSFENEYRRECRGIKFDQDGYILSRVMRKFFNVNERPETQESQIDWSRPHVVTEKLDGSMVYSSLIQNQIRLMTRKGITDVSRSCEEQWLSYIHDFLDAADISDTTFTFEWTSPQNRIVVPYTKDSLSLLAIRDNTTGYYWEYDSIKRTSKDMKLSIPNILASDAYGDWQGLLRHCNDLEDQEGFVLWFLDGAEPHALKIKAPWYVTRHRALDSMRHEHHVVSLILDGGIDDIYPLLPRKDRQALENFSETLHTAIYAHADRMDEYVERARENEASRKDFAIHWASAYPKEFRGILFQVWDGAGPQTAIRELLRKQASSGPRSRVLLETLGVPPWDSF